MKEKILKLFTENGILCQDLQADKLSTFYRMVIEKNKVMNLTAITDEDEFLVKHLLDSVFPYELIKGQSKVLDVGSGAGFPAVPLAILKKDCSFVMIDALNKRVSFLNEVIFALNLNAKAIHARSEDYAYDQKNREQFDMCVARAVASLPTLCELCLPFVKVGGYFMAYKSQEENITTSEKAIKTMGGEVSLIKDFELPSNYGKRRIVLIKKIKNTPKIYPRGKNLPKLRPIM